MNMPQDVKSILLARGITELYPPQAEALPHVFSKKNLVLAIPTASGKSLVAYLAALNGVLSGSGKAIYIVPLRALASEKFEELSAFSSLGIKVGISTGDLDEAEPRLADNDIIVCTSEKADSLMRHRAAWLREISVVVADEVHLINDAGRGPTLEVILTRFKAINPSAQIVALSATIKNARDLAMWLDAELVQSEWRPVVLKEGIFDGTSILFTDNTVREVPGNEKDAVAALALDTIAEGGQTLVFVNTRRSTEAVAEKLAPKIRRMLDERGSAKAKALSETFLRGQSEPTSLGERAAKLIERGVAFHNAGLDSFQRKTVERGFKDGIIKCIVATPTLAAGVNTPARRVIIRDVWRHDANLGIQPVPILEIRQMMGRAGRPGYDPYGEAVLIARSDDEAEKLRDIYLLSDTEPIVSKLGTEAALRTHVLSAVATGFVSDDGGLRRFIDSTFYAQQSDSWALYGRIEETVEFLEENCFVESVGEKLSATIFGRMTSDLYIDPLSAIMLKGALERSCNVATAPLSYLHAICATPDMLSLYLRQNDNWVEEKIEEFEAFLLEKPSRYDSEYEWFAADVKTASLIEDWIDEVSEDRLIDKYGVGPGDIHGKVEIAEWLLHAARELARAFNFACVTELTKLIMRIRNGCREELLNLIKLENVGRVRARAIYGAGFKTLDSLRGVPVDTLSRIPTIGRGIAESIKRQLGEEIAPEGRGARRKKEEAAADSETGNGTDDKQGQLPRRSGQSSLMQFKEEKEE